MTSFAEWLRSVRTDQRRPGWSQDRLAAAALARDPKSSVYQGRLSEWERGVGLPNLRQLVLVGLVLELTEDEARAGREAWDAAQLHELSSTP